MTVDTSAAHRPLYDPVEDGDSWVPPVDIALDQARAALAEAQTASIHDDRALLRVAVHLDMRLRGLVAALDQEAGR